MNFDKINISDLVNDEKNPRKDLTPEDAEFVKIDNSIKAFGFMEPITYNNRTMKIIGGHQRLKTLIERGITELEVISRGAYSWAFPPGDLDELTPDEEMAANIALNKATGAWDFEQLIVNMQELKANEFDISLTGFDENEFGAIFESRPDAPPPDFTPVPADEVPRLDEKKKVKCPECGNEFTP